MQQDLSYHTEGWIDLAYSNETSESIAFISQGDRADEGVVTQQDLSCEAYIRQLLGFLDNGNQVVSFTQQLALDINSLTPQKIKKYFESKIQEEFVKRVRVIDIHTEQPTQVFEDIFEAIAHIYSERIDQINENTISDQMAKQKLSNNFEFAITQYKLSIIVKAAEQIWKNLQDLEKQLEEKEQTCEQETDRLNGDIAKLREEIAYLRNIHENLNKWNKKQKICSVAMGALTIGAVVTAIGALCVKTPQPPPVEPSKGLLNMLGYVLNQPLYVKSKIN